MTFELIADLLYKIASVIVPAFLGWVYASIKDLKKVRDAERQGLKAILGKFIKDAYREYNELGYYSFDARTELDILYNAYHALGGNGTVDEAMARLRNLPYDPPEVGDD